MMRLNLQTTIYLGLFLRLLVAAWNGFVGPSFGANSDALAFHMMAADYARNLASVEFQIGWIYSWCLGVVYYLTTDSLFIGCLLSCLAWAASAGILVKTMRLLSIQRSHQLKIGLIYALLPSSILFTGVTLREPYQLLFVNLAIYSALMIVLRKSTKHWVVMVVAALGMGMLHGALFAFGLFIGVATLVLLALRGRRGVSLKKLAFMAPLIALVAFYGLSVFASASYNLDKGLDVAVASYQQGALGVDARANYSSGVNINSTVDLLFFVPVSLFQYLFEPMPWRASASADAVALFENSLRAWLIWKAATGLRAMPTQGRRPVLFVFIAYIMIETIWSLGTVNWGTALRHHLPSFGLLVVAAFAYAGQRSTRRASSLDASVNAAVS